MFGKSLYEIVVKLVIPFGIPLVILNAIYSLIAGGNAINAWPYHPEKLAVDTKFAILSSHNANESLRDLIHNIELEGKRVFGPTHTWQIDDYRSEQVYESDDLIRWEAADTLRSLAERRGHSADVDRFREDYRVIRREYSRVVRFLENTSSHAKKLARSIESDVRSESQEESETRRKSVVHYLGTPGPPLSSVNLDSTISAEEMERDIIREIETAMFTIGKTWNANRGREFPPNAARSQSRKRWFVGITSSVWGTLVLLIIARRRKLGIGRRKYV